MRRYLHRGHPTGEIVTIERTQSRCCSGGMRTGVLNFTVSECDVHGRCLPHYTVPMLLRSERVLEGEWAQPCLTCHGCDRGITATNPREPDIP